MGRPRMPLVHGTVRGYRQHIGRHTMACTPCLDAWRAEMRTYRAELRRRVAARIADPTIPTTTEVRSAGYPKSCRHCGHAFRSQRPDARYCRHACRQAAAYRRAKAGTPPA